MKYPFIYVSVFFYLIIPFGVSSQERAKMDSLLVLLANHSAQDTARVDWTYDVVGIMLDYNPDSCIQLCREGMNLSHRLGYTKGISRGYLNEGMIAHYLEQNMDKAKAKYDTALIYARQINHFKLLCGCHNNLGQICIDRGQYLEATLHYDSASIYAEKAHYTYAQSRILTNLAFLHHNTGNFNLSLQYYIRALRVAETINDLGQQSFCENNIARCLISLKRFPEAEEHLRKSQAILEKIQNPLFNAQVQQSFGNIHFLQGDYAAALPFFQSAYGIFKHMDNMQQLEALSCIARSQKMLGRYTEAEQNFQQLLTQAQNENAVPGIALYHHELGELYEQMGRTDLALQHFHHGVALAERVTNASQLRADYASLGKIYGRRGDFQKAATFWEKANAFADSVYNAEITNRIQQQLLEDNFRQQNLADSLANLRQQTLLNQKLTTQRNATFAGWSFAGLAALLTLLFWNRFRLRKRVESLEHERVVDRFRAQKAESEMTALRAQMNPHFIFNSLNSINAYILRNDGKTANAYLTGFAHLMRQILDNSARETISLENEIEFLQSYLRTEAMRLENKLTWDIQVADNVDTFETEIPSMILQPYVENAVWHGIAHRPEGGKITVSIGRDTSGALLLAVEDDGVGRARARELRTTNGKPHESKGLKITEERLALYDQKHGTRSSVTTTDLIDSEGNAVGIRAEVRIT